MSKQLTTAETLGAFRRGLEKEGFDRDEAFTLTRDALSSVVSPIVEGQGVVVKSDG